MRGRQGHHRAGDAENLAVLRRDVSGADVRHLYPRNIALAASARTAMSRSALGKQALAKQALGKVDKHVFSRIEDDRCSADSFKLHQSCRCCGTDIAPHAVCLDW